MEPFSRGIIAEIGKQAAKGERRKVRDVLVVTMVSLPSMLRVVDGYGAGINTRHATNSCS